MKHGLKLIGIGLALGLLGAFLVTRLLTSLLFAVEPFDPLTVTAVLGLLTVVAAIACLVPARRATLIDPIAALRHQ
jgi:ABC-type lipoprotein release transport system permease subunit